MLSIDLNCDMGEGYDSDASIMPFISSANIACGGHAGDDASMRNTIKLAKSYGVQIGAHPSYPDKSNFGRLKMDCNLNDIRNFLAEQVLHFMEVAISCGADVSHIKPHGALYNAAAGDLEIASTIAETIKQIRGDLLLFGLSNSQSEIAAKKHELRFCREAFADRTYTNEGRLTPRSSSNSMIENTEDALNQVLHIIKKNTVISTTGHPIHIHADTICIHGDGEHAVEFAEALHKGLKENQIKVSPTYILNNID